MLNPEKERVAGSHGERHAFMIEEQSPPGAARSTFHVIVPVVIGAKKFGYVDSEMTTRNLERRFEHLRATRS